VDNSNRLKELQVVSGALKEGDKGLGFIFLFQKGVFFGEEGRMDKLHPFPKEVFFKGLGEMNFI